MASPILEKLVGDPGGQKGIDDLLKLEGDKQLLREDDAGNIFRVARNGKTEKCLLQRDGEIFKFPMSHKGKKVMIPFIEPHLRYLFPEYMEFITGKTLGDEKNCNLFLCTRGRVKNQVALLKDLIDETVSSDSRVTKFLQQQVLSLKEKNPSLFDNLQQLLTISYPGFSHGWLELVNPNLYLPSTIQNDDDLPWVQPYHFMPEYGYGREPAMGAFEAIQDGLMTLKVSLLTGDNGRVQDSGRTVDVLKLSKAFGPAITEVAAETVRVQMEILDLLGQAGFTRYRIGLHMFPEENAMADNPQIFRQCISNSVAVMASIGIDTSQFDFGRFFRPIDLHDSIETLSERDHFQQFRVFGTSVGPVGISKGRDADGNGSIILDAGGCNTDSMLNILTALKDQYGIMLRGGQIVSPSNLTVPKQHATTAVLQALTAISSNAQLQSFDEYRLSALSQRQ